MLREKVSVAGRQVEVTVTQVEDPRALGKIQHHASSTVDGVIFERYAPSATEAVENVTKKLAEDLTDE